MVRVSAGGRMEMPEMSLWKIAEGGGERWTLKANACPHKNKWKGRTFRGYRGHHLAGLVGSVAGARMEWVIRAPSPEACRKEGVVGEALMPTNGCFPQKLLQGEGGGGDVENCRCVNVVSGGGDGLPQARPRLLMEFHVRRWRPSPRFQRWADLLPSDRSS